MFRFVALIFALVTTSVWAAPILAIKNPKEYSFDQQKLEAQFKIAAEKFEKEIAPLEGTIHVTVSPETCLRTGYNRELDAVEFCPGKSVHNAGLDSIDVINHELFHAFICHMDQNLCDMQGKDYLHEALADTFAYQLNPDDVFGEDFYKSQLYLRKYLTTLRPGLVQGEHEKGNAFASIFISQNYSFAKMISLFQEEDAKDEVKNIITGAPESRLNRYRLHLNESMQIEFIFEEVARVAQVVWILPAGVELEQLSDFSFSIKMAKEPDSSKGFALFFDENGKELGRRAYYFGLRKN